MLYTSWNVRLSACPCVSLFTFEVPFKRLFATTSQNRMSTLLCHRCYYPHRSRDALSPVCGIFLWQLFSILTMSFFLAFFAISFELVCCTESVQQKNDWLVTKRLFLTVFVTNLMIPLSHWLRICPLLSPKGFRISKNIEHPTSGSGGKKTF